MFDKITKHIWMHVPQAERDVLALAFGLERTGVAEIRDTEVISDGYSDENLSKINAASMAIFVGEPEGTELSVPRLWEITCSKARSILNPPMFIRSVAPVVEEKADEVTDVHGEKDK